MRRAARRDGNDAPITEALRAQGFTVYDYGKAGEGIPDKLVTRPLSEERLWVCWVEIKMPRGKLRDGQERFRDIFGPRGEHYVARDPQVAVIELTRRWLDACGPGEG